MQVLEKTITKYRGAKFFVTEKLDGTSFTHGSGPVFRMVIALGPSGVRGQNVIPGGQSGDPGNPHFSDQAPLWLANQTMPLRYLPEEVAAGATSRERFVPAP